jgi:integrase/recombinase XerD
MKNKIVRVAERSSIRASEKQKKLIQDFITSRKAKGLDWKTIDKYECSLYKFVKYAGTRFDFKKAKREDIAKVLAKTIEVPQGVRRKLYIHVKVFYKWLLGNDEDYPDIVRWMRAPEENNKEILPKDLLTFEEINRMIEAASNPRDKAIISLLYDSGIRPGELENMKRKDVELADNLTTGKIHVNGKTGEREVPIFFSAVYLAAYINGLEKNGNDDEKPLWHAIGTWSKKLDRPIYQGAIRKMLQETAEKAGIKKHIKMYLFRHSRLTDYAKSIPESLLKKFAGHAPSSEATSTYIHLSGRDLEDALSEVNGINKVEKKEEKKVENPLCPRCKTANMPDALYCSKCTSPMTITVAMSQIEQDKEQKKLISDMIKNGIRKEIASVFVNTYKYAEKHKKKVKSLDDLSDIDYDIKTKERRNEMSEFLKEIQTGFATWTRRRHKAELEDRADEVAEKIEK